MKKVNKQLVAIANETKFEFILTDSDNKVAIKQVEIENNLFRSQRDDYYKTLYLFGFSDNNETFSPSIYFVWKICNLFIKKLMQTPEIETLKEKVKVEINNHSINELLNTMPFMLGRENINELFIVNLFDKLNDVFVEQIAKCESSVSDYFNKITTKIQPVGRVYFHLVENKDDELPFAFLATYTEVTENNKVKHIPLKNALIKYNDNKDELLKLLSTVNKVIKVSNFIKELVDSGEIFHPLKLNSDEAYIFLTELFLYEECGILCRVPNWWQKANKNIKANVSLGNKNPSIINFDALVDFNIELMIGDIPISLEELKQIIQEAEGLRLIRGNWVEVDKEKLEQLLIAYEQLQKVSDLEQMSIKDAIHLQLMGSSDQKINFDSDIIEVSNGKWLSEILTKLVNPNSLEDVDPGVDFNADLRNYQEDGLKWLATMNEFGFGACLADDMGLGKTIQVIALLNSLHTNKQNKTLIVIPASLISNWTNEIKRFAPKLKSCVVHPSFIKPKELKIEKIIESNDILITTYSMTNRYNWLYDYNWDVLIIDEAQAIKNASTKQTKNIKRLKANYRIALTGTPIENKLQDLWSLFDFLNQGLLGTSSEFAKFVKNLNNDLSGYTKLRKIINPFILRRLKTDKSIINDLPDKIEMKTYANLTKKQMVLYNELVKDLTKTIKNAEGINRKGLVLASISKFKQICNHPDHYLGQQGFLEAESGKFERLKEICEQIKLKRERVLVFTQFKEMVEPLADYLTEIFEQEGLILHGSIAVAKRKQIVDKFQQDDYVPFMVLSIKAGGVGLNLTAANHVVHFDRWWNPAIENQATDRAFRIGQNKKVIVHKFISNGTIEEKIDLMIENKMSLANEIITPTTGENWITELNNDELIDLFKLTN